MSDGKPDKKSKKAKKGEQEALTVSISAHPRAKASIRRSRTRAAFGAFILVLALNLLGHQELQDALLRALIAGILVNVIVWRCAIIVWKHIILSELRQEEERRLERMREQQERLAKMAAERAENAA